MAQEATGGRALWGGHFDTDPAPLMAQINASIGFDKRLYAQESPAPPRMPGCWHSRHR